MKITFFSLLTFVLFFTACQNNSAPKEKNIPTPQKAITETPRNFVAFKTKQSPAIDGKATEACWQKTGWYPMQEHWLGDSYSPQDFQGRYKLTWDEKHIYILAEIVDDTLIDIHPDGLKQYWDDDCLEIFIDEDRSKGNHQYSHNAFAYHISLDNRVVDIGPDTIFRYYTDHLKCQRITKGNTSIWEVAMSVYSDEFQDEKKDNIPMQLTKDKVAGFAIAYCDNDRSAERENFIGSVVVEGEDKNRGWIDAGIFGRLTLRE